MRPALKMRCKVAQGCWNFFAEFSENDLPGQHHRHKLPLTLLVAC